jgi:hypothetical protein
MMGLAAGNMPDDNAQNREDAVRDRIARLMQADAPPRKQITQDEVEELKAASGRLDRMLGDAAAEERAREKQRLEEDVAQLKAAAGRLDRLLTAMARNEPVSELKLRRRNRAGNS